MDGFYKYFKIDPDTESKSCQGVFRIQDGQLQILDDQNGILKHLLKQGPVTPKTLDVMRSGLHSPYFVISRDDSAKTQDKYRTPIHNDTPPEDAKSKMAGTIKLEALKDLLENEDDDVEVDIPEHLVLQNSNWRMDGQ